MAKKTLAPNKASAKKAKASPSKKKHVMPSVDRIVCAIASRHSLGEEKPCRTLIRGLAAIINRKSFDTTIAAMKKKDRWVEYDKVSIWLTEEGKDYVGPKALAVPQTNDAMQDKIRTEVIKGRNPNKIFEFMLDGRWYSRAELAKAMELPDNKSFGTYISCLSKVVERKNGKIRLADMVFPVGRPSE